MKLKAPNVFVLMCSILVLVGALTWILPGGEFDREEKDIPNYGTKVVVIPGSYKEVEAVPQGPTDILMSPMYGFHDHEREHPRDGSLVIGFILLIGGAFGVLQKTGALMAVLGWITMRAKGAGRFAMIPILMFMFSAGGALFGMAEESIVFVMVTVPLAVALRFDVITGIAIPFVGSQAGFATAFVNPFTLGIAKGISGQEMGVGTEFRVICWLIVTSLCSGLVLWHAWRVSADPSRSLTPKLDREWTESFHASTGPGSELQTRHVWVMVCFLGSMILLGYGAVQLGWYIYELAALFMGMALLCGLVGRLSLGEIADSFMEGAKSLCSTAILVAFARAIMILADDGKIVDTILYHLSEAMKDLGPLGGTECMFAVQTFINFFVPSGSGQAALTMPVMSPLAQILNIHQENAILAYQFGDGFTNMIIPTNPVLIGCISVARLSYGTWFRWMIKYQLILFAVGMILLALSPFHSA